MAVAALRRAAIEHARPCPSSSSAQPSRAVQRRAAHAQCRTLHSSRSLFPSAGVNMMASANGCRQSRTGPRAWGLGPRQRAAKSTAPPVECAALSIPRLGIRDLYQEIPEMDPYRDYNVLIDIQSPIQFGRHMPSI